MLAVVEKEKYIEDMIEKIWQPEGFIMATWGAVSVFAAKLCY